MSVPVTAFYAALLTILFLYLSVQVIVHRREYKVVVGDGGDKHVKHVVRAHANFAEYVPLTLILMLVAEMNNVGDTWLHLGGTGLIIGRMIHAYGLRHHFRISWQLFVGTGLTYLSMFLLATLNLLMFY